MRLGIVTDSACDLPRSFFDEYRIPILPISFRSGDKVMVDHRDPAETQAFYRRLSAGESDHESVAFTREQIEDLFLSRLVIDYDYVFCITLSSSRGVTFENATQASYAILNRYREVRAKAGVEGPFRLRVVDSKNFFPGEGLIVAEAARMAKRDATSTQIADRIEELTNTTQGFLVPAELGHLRKQGRRRGDKSVSLLSYALGTALDIKPIVRAYRGETSPIAKIRGFEAGVKRLFDITRQQIGKGLKTNTVCISYGGDPRRVTELPGYAELAGAANGRNVEILISEMSLTAGVNIGPGGLAIAFASDEEVAID